MSALVNSKLLLILFIAVQIDVVSSMGEWVDIEVRQQQVAKQDNK
tara:strand:- start:11243 stop:11377 length:135 start_codon:yes stop_codon:yes gene_type:complete